MPIHNVFTPGSLSPFLARNPPSFAIIRTPVWKEGLNVIENWNSANDFIWYGKGGEIATNNKEEQEIAILALHLLQICMVYINTLLVQKVLSEQEWLSRMQAEDFRGLTPLFYGHVNPYGRLILNMNERIMI